LKVIACYSNKGGVGKTATAVNLAYAFADDGLKVLLVDLDPQGASGFYFRVKPSKKLLKDAFFQDEKRFVKAIRGSDFSNLDLLPSNSSFRDFDLFLAQMKKSRSRLKKTLRTVESWYDLIVLDCPPNISKLSESIFATADQIIVPVIPTTLSERTLDQLFDFFQENDYAKAKLTPFFSMVQSQKSLHKDTIARLSQSHRKRFLSTQVPFSADIEKMGIHRAPVATFAAFKPAAKAYGSLQKEIRKRLLKSFKGPN